MYKLCQGIHHPPETERWQSAERDKMAAVEQKKMGNISCKLQQFFLWNVGYLFNVKKKTGAEREVFGLYKHDIDLFHPLWDQSRVSWFVFLLPSCQCMKASTCKSLCVMESHNGSIITLKPRRAECDCKMCVHKCVCVCVCTCIYVRVCGHMLWWLHCKGFTLMPEIHSDTALLHDGNALYVLHLSQKGQADDIHMHHEWKSAETRTNTSEKWRGLWKKERKPEDEETERETED